LPVAGAATIELDFQRPAAPPKSPVDIAIGFRIDGKQAGSGLLRTALPATFSISDSLDIGRDDGSTATPETAAPLDGAIGNVVFDFRSPP